MNRYLVKKGVPWPQDANKFRLSPSAFAHLRSYFNLSLTFTSSLANIHHPPARACPLPSQMSTNTLDFWFILPVRVQVDCPDKKKGHASYSTGKSQMNPLNYLHLSKPEVDIRGSHIGVYFRFDEKSVRSSTLLVNFQDGRWRRIVEEPILRIKEAMEAKEREDSGRDPFYLQTILVTSILRWWSNALNSFNDQLIAHEEKILAEEQDPNLNFSTLNSETSRGLHCMAAHLHRYSSEITLLSDTVQDIKTYNTDSHAQLVKHGIRSSDSLEFITRSIDQISAHLSSISYFRAELQLKTDNVLSLLVSTTQIQHSSLLLTHNATISTILLATQSSTAQSRLLTGEISKILASTHAETKASLAMARQTQCLSEDMRRDSVNMKTIALLTVLFLPGTSIAAVLSMPFFSGSGQGEGGGGEGEGWMSRVGGVWVWVVLTVPVTALCFAFYRVWGRRRDRRERGEGGGGGEDGDGDDGEKV
ncbi:hypothetical protein K491DRAFT_689038 [Lophiostoma macrostomum CBS 122681]|uniref:Cora-domain-containing protein n=1 Tax=Lophiostoma macrostomum CBS 122681 TaxID=1314788 RepID=A0A6A6TIH3_9PLEO|nr:hypothetical protein K491DRAFT_689038 [Lophiostoma macrostomum CBS 122681]